MGRPGPACEISLIREPDLAAIARIEKESGGTWSQAMFAEECGHPAAIVLVARRVKESGHWSGIIGFISIRVVADEAEITRLAVTMAARRQGVAASLLEQALIRAEQAGAAHCYLELRAGNTPALRLYQKHGFVASGERRNYYSDPLEDALLMAKRLKR